MNDKFMIYAFSSPYVTEKAYREYAECGYTAVLIDQNEGGPGTENFERSIAFCDQFGIDAYPMAYNKDFPPAGDTTDYMAHPRFAGVCFWDEPLASQIPEIGTWVEGFEKKFPGKTFYVNLASNYWDPDFGAQYPDGYTRVNKYVDLYCDEVLEKLHGRKILSMDIYPLMQREDGRKVLRKEWIKHLELCALIARRRGYEFHFYIQTTGGWDAVAKTPLETASRAPETMEDLRIQCYGALAYGARGIAHFTYKSQTAFRETAVADENGPTHRYPLVKRMNEELQALAPFLLPYAWQRTGTVNGKIHSDYADESFAMLSENSVTFEKLRVRETSRDLLVGEFKNEAGGYAYILVNYTEPTERAECRVDLALKGEKAVFVREGMASAPAAAGKCSVTLRRGEGVFIIIE